MSKIFLISLALCVFSGVIIYYFTITYTHTLKTENSSPPSSETGTSMEAYFAGGCFWCMEGIFESQSGVIQAVSGYAGGTQETANYEIVSAGQSTHREAVEVTYDPSLINYATLVDLYFTQIDPTQTDGQFGDRGYRYTTAILYSTDEERKIAESTIAQLEASKKFEKPIVVKVEARTTFFPAEEYHQDYYKKSTFRYNLYKKGSGRAGYIEKTWNEKIAEIEKNQKSGLPDISQGKVYGNSGVNSGSTLREKLTDIQYEVTQNGATEIPYKNPYWDNHEVGIYVDIIDGTPLFSSKDKFDSGTGWPSFTRPIDSGVLLEKSDFKIGEERIEVIGKKSDSHLGHVFDDGPVDQGGKRYCINSASLRFIPYSDFEREGYGKYSTLFQ